MFFTELEQRPRKRTIVLQTLEKCELDTNKMERVESEKTGGTQFTWSKYQVYWCIGRNVFSSLQHSWIFFNIQWIFFGEVTHQHPRVFRQEFLNMHTIKMCENEATALKNGKTLHCQKP